MRPLRLRAGAVILALGLPIFSSCSEQLTMAVSPTASWRLDWAVNLDVRCIGSTDQEIASRHRLTGASTFRVHRPVGDDRPEIEIQDEETTLRSAAFTLHGNCDPTVHQAATVVTQPLAEGEWTTVARVLDRPGADSLHVVITGRFTPAIVRFRMKDSASTVVEKAVIDAEPRIEFTIPYTYRTLAHSRTGHLDDGAIGYAYNLTMTYAGD